MIQISVLQLSSFAYGLKSLIKNGSQIAERLLVGGRVGKSDFYETPTKGIVFELGLSWGLAILQSCKL